MQLNVFGLLTLALASVGTSSLTASELHSQGGQGNSRPVPHPFHPGKPHKPSPPCTKTCVVARPKAAAVVKGVKTPYDSGRDVLKAVRSCNPKGRVLFEKGQTYLINTALDLSNLENVDLDIQGTIKVNYNRSVSIQDQTHIYNSLLMISTTGLDMHSSIISKILVRSGSLVATMSTSMAVEQLTGAVRPGGMLQRPMRVLAR